MLPPNLSYPKTSVSPPNARLRAPQGQIIDTYPTGETIQYYVMASWTSEADDQWFCESSSN